MSVPAPEDRELIVSAQAGDRAAMEQMTLRHDALVKFVVRRFSGRGAEADDLYQLGRLGLVKAIRNFDTRYDVRFSTYAVPLIMGEIRRFLRDDGQIHVSRSIRQNAQRIQAYCQACGEEAPPVEQIAQALGLSGEDVLLAIEAAQRPRSLSEPLGEDGLLLEDVLGKDDTERTLERIELSRLLNLLSEREREVIMRRYYRDETQAVVARALGMTQVQVSRLESRIIRRLREEAAPV